MKIKIERISSTVILAAMFLCISSCSRGSVREKAILGRYTVETRQKYADLLVDVSRYTSKGDEFQKKYLKYLIGIAGDIVENKNLRVDKGSIGFYYDKKSGDTTKLYLGIDISTKKEYSQPFSNVAVRLLRNDLRKIMETIHSCKTIFEEDDVLGMVIGWSWYNQGVRERVSIWIPKGYMDRFEGNKITFDELVQMSTVTNTAGRIILLPL